MKSLPKKLTFLFLMSLITISPKLARADDASDEDNYQKIVGMFTQFSSMDDLKKQGYEFSVTGAPNLKDGSSDDNDCPIKLVLKVDGPFATLSGIGDQKIIITQDNLHFPAHAKDVPTGNDTFYLVKDSQGRLVLVGGQNSAMFITMAPDAVLMQQSQKMAFAPTNGGCILNKDAPAQVSASVADASKAVKVQGLIDASAAGTAKVDLQAPAK